jgi:hypothetical protein
MPTESEEQDSFAPMFDDEDERETATTGWCICMLKGDFGTNCVCEGVECYCLVPGVQPGVKVCICERCIVKRHIKERKDIHK